MNIKDRLNYIRGEIPEKVHTPKYRLLKNESIQWEGRVVLYRIQALKDFGEIKEGDLGGWIESEDNLSQEGDCWVYDDAKVFDDAIVNAMIMNDAKVCEKAKVCENAIIMNDDIVCGNDIIGGYDNAL